MAENAEQAAAFMKALSHPGRLMILCHLGEGEASVGELNDQVGMSQSSISQHLAMLRREGLVLARREGQQVIYSLADDETRQVIGVLHDIFCRKTR